MILMMEETSDVVFGKTMQDGRREEQDVDQYSVCSRM